MAYAFFIFAWNFSKARALDASGAYVKHTNRSRPLTKLALISCISRHLRCRRLISCLAFSVVRRLPALCLGDMPGIVPML